MTKSNIKILDPIVADQIAAGEVVERPASVIKELVENSIDAGATRIQIELDGGGAARMRVLDNGVGLGPEEIKLAFKRHATSKIGKLVDLEGVATFGFRGEALPSISSVSRVTVHTRTDDSVAGTRLKMEGGKLLEEREVGCPVGTDFEVADLFYNTPARLKFLKKETTEAGHCAEAVMRLALIRPEVSFTVISQGRRTRELPRVERPRERVAALFPNDDLAISESERDGIRTLAILGPPQRAKAGAGSLYTYVNGRFVRDRAMLRAVTQAFAGTLEPGRYPVGYVSIQLPPGAFDVNVHPQKTEVRFADQSSVYRAITRAVGEMTARSVWTVGAVPTGEAPPRDNAVSEEAQSYDNAPSGSFIPRPSARPDNRFMTPMAATPATPAAAFPGGPVPKAPVQLDMNDSAQPEAAPFSRLRFVGQAKNTFLIMEEEDGLVLIDQHAAHERVTFERLRAELNDGRVSTQRLLMPHTVDLGPAETERIVEFEQHLDKLGLEISRSGPDRISIRSVPAELAGASPDRLLADMVMAIEESRAGSRGETDDHVLATMACHGSIRAGRTVEGEEVRTLLAAMDKIDFAGHCPHGRPVLTRFPWSEIRRRVGRE